VIARWCFVLGLLAAWPLLAAAPARVVPGRSLVFPADHGAHKDFRTEWWYVTGWLDAPDGPVGFQVTFFRSRPDVDPANPSAFAPRQVIFAHVALSDPKAHSLQQAQRIAREGFGLAAASATDTDITLDDWHLQRNASGSFTTRIATPAFDLDLSLAPGQPVLAQGEQGYSQKGPSAEQASYYYSLPHLAVTGRLRRGTATVAVHGEAWLDREWSSTLLDPRGVGWDWAGLNMDDGAAITAFRVRDAAGRAIWAGGSLRAADGAITIFRPADVMLEPRRRWVSPRSGAAYPVDPVLSVRGPAGWRHLPLAPLMDDQELDTRGTGGPVYWEGAVRTAGGRGYLELVGYGAKITL
jgi:predicted secreted hydrolase